MDLKRDWKMQDSKKKKSVVNVCGPSSSQAGHCTAVVSALSDHNHCRWPAAEAHSLPETRWLCCMSFFFFGSLPWTCQGRDKGCVFWLFFAPSPDGVCGGGYCSAWLCVCALPLCLCSGYGAAWADKGCVLHSGTDTQGSWEHFFRAVPLTGCMTLVNYLISASPSRKWWWYLPASQEKHLGFIKD